MSTLSASPAARRGQAVAVVWENFGPTHDDRCEALAKRLAHSGIGVVGVELASRSSVYEWNSEHAGGYRRVTLFDGTSIDKVDLFRKVRSLVSACLKNRVRYVFLCHYENMSTLVSAFILRLLGMRVFVMNDSKYDDYERHMLREVGKYIFYSPYQGALAAGPRSRDYLRFLGVSDRNIFTPYNSISLERVRRMSQSPPAPGGAPFRDRHFTVVARLVPKKNLTCAIEAYRSYAESVTNPRRLVICGSGVQEPLLREQIAKAGLTDMVEFRGFVQSEGVSQTLATSLALLLPSVEEQFGIVVIEAQALGVPVIISDNCGARDEMVRTAVNGFVVEPDNPAGFAFFMRMLSEDEQLWRDMSVNAERFARLGDVERFADAAVSLMERLP